MSGKYKIDGKNGKGQKYLINTKTLIFEGEYLNGRKNGKGKEYNYCNGKLLFEGEYLNGSKNGKGKEYYSNSKIKFEGEYLNGIKWNGKGYNINGNIEFVIKDGKISKNLLFLLEKEYKNFNRNMD